MRLLVKSSKVFDVAGGTPALLYYGKLMVMAEVIGVGIIGYGAMYSMGKHHSAEVRATDGLELRAIFDVLPERREAARDEQHDVAVHDTYDQMLADSAIDLVVIVTPHHTHCELSTLASNAGKHVMVEKVMCLSTAETSKMIEAADLAGKMLTVYQNRRWDGDFLTMQKVIDSGVLGKLFQIESSVNGFYFPDGWRGKKEYGGGMLYDWGAHLCDQLCTLLRPSKPESVYAISHFGAHDVDIETQTTAMIRFDNGASAEIDVGCMSYQSRPRWIIRGEQGAVTMPDWHSATLKTGEGEDSIEVEETRWSDLYQNVADHLILGKELKVRAPDVAESIAVIEAAFRSAETGEVVHLGGKP